MADIQQNTGDAGGAMTAIIAILVIVVIGLALYFGFRGRDVNVPNTGTTVELNNTTDGGGSGGSDGGSSSGGTTY